MVSHKKHKSDTKKALGNEYAWVHRYMDAPYAWKIPVIKDILPGVPIPVIKYEKIGRQHRVLRHDIQTAIEIGMQGKNLINKKKKKNPEDFGAMLAALLHLMQDGEI